MLRRLEPVLVLSPPPASFQSTGLSFRIPSASRARGGCGRGGGRGDLDGGDGEEEEEAQKELIEPLHQPGGAKPREDEDIGQEVTPPARCHQVNTSPDHRPGSRAPTCPARYRPVPVSALLRMRARLVRHRPHQGKAGGWWWWWWRRRPRLAGPTCSRAHAARRQAPLRPSDSSPPPRLAQGRVAAKRRLARDIDWRDVRPPDSTGCPSPDIRCPPTTHTRQRQCTQEAGKGARTSSPTWERPSAAGLGASGGRRGGSSEPAPPALRQAQPRTCRHAAAAPTGATPRKGRPT